VQSNNQPETGEMNIPAVEVPPQGAKQQGAVSAGKVISNLSSLAVGRDSVSKFPIGQGPNSLLQAGALGNCTPAGSSQIALSGADLVLFHPSRPLFSYEVDMIRPIAPAIAETMVKLPPGVTLSPLTIRRYIMDAYGAVYPPQVVGGPDWLNKDAYLIKGKVPDELEPALQKMKRDERVDNTRAMQQCLLAERFHLKAHFETRVLPVYELVPDKGGLKIIKDIDPEKRKPGETSAHSRSTDSLDPGSSRTTVNSDGMRVLNARAIKMQLLMRIISGDIGDRPIVDHTGYTGSFDISDLTWAPLGDPESSGNSDAHSIQLALKQTLGLRVVSAKDPIEVLVIDSIDRPTPN
jgi:uncharacterized protein (TIGR03435 family)